jgi:transposase InsO family protein
MVDQKFTPAYHSQANGPVERFMSTLKQMIKAYMDRNTNHIPWDRHLSEFQLAYNSSLHPGTNFTPFSFVHGREPRLLGEIYCGVMNISHEDYTDMTKSF